MSVATGNVATFSLPSRDPQDDSTGQYGLPVIQNVRDNIREQQTRSFYEIVNRGFHDDVSSYVDRKYVWSGVGSSNIPDFLEGADYVKTFNDDKIRSLTVTLELSQPADVYLLWDNRVRPTEWLKRDLPTPVTGWIWWNMVDETSLLAAIRPRFEVVRSGIGR